jgi:Sec-independent protein translocase protein TatA
VISPADIAILGAVALLLFGPEQLPKVARRVGSVVRDVQNTSQSFIREMERAADLQEEVDRSKLLPAIPVAPDFPAPQDYVPAADHHAPHPDTVEAELPGVPLPPPTHDGDALEPAQISLLATEPVRPPEPSLFDEPKR